MPDQPSRGRGSRARRAEEFWNRITLLVGCGAVVGIVASVIMVITQQVMKPPMVDEEYVAASDRNESPTAVWSGNTKSDVSLMQAVESKSKAASAPVATPVSLTEAMKAQAVVAGIEDIDSKRDAIAASLSAFRHHHAGEPLGLDP